MFGIDDMAAATLISGGVSGLASAFGNLLGASSQSKANKANMKLAQYQNEVNRENWRMANEYNSPVQQMARLKDAGLNPNLVYENGASGNTTSSPANYEAPRMQAYTNYGDFGASHITNSLMTAAQIQQMNKQNKNLEIDYAAKRQQMLRESIQMARDMMENSYYRDTRDSAKRLMELSVSQAEQNIFNSQLTASKLRRDTQLVAARVHLAKLEGRISNATLKKMNAELPGIIANSNILQKTYKDWEDTGIRPTDPLWARAIAKATGTLTSPEERKDRMKVIEYLRNESSLPSPTGQSIEDVEEDYKNGKYD